MRRKCLYFLATIQLYFVKPYCTVDLYNLFLILRKRNKKEKKEAAQQKSFADVLYYHYK